MFDVGTLSQTTDLSFCVITLLVCNFPLGNAILKITTPLCSVISTLHDAEAKSSLPYTCQIIIKNFETVFFCFLSKTEIENTNINNRDFYYVRLRQQTLSLGSVDLRQQNNSFKNYCNPPPPWLPLCNLDDHR